jgi:hypothetical protein
LFLLLASGTCRWVIHGGACKHTLHERI